MLTDTERDLTDTEQRMDRLREAHVAKRLKGEITRVQTTTFNAKMGQLAERRDALRKMLKQST